MSKITTQNKYYFELLQLLNEEKIYLDQELTLVNLAKRIGISRSYMSILISQRFQCNYRSLINKYRIEHFLSNFEKLDQKQTIMSLAFQSGFNSKSTFHD